MSDDEIALLRSRSGWDTFEVVVPARDRKAVPVFEAFAYRSSEAKQGMSKMLKVEEAGFPYARDNFRVSGGRKKAIVRADDLAPFLWELKCTPHAWRLLFITIENPLDESDKRLVYLHAYYKNTDAQDPSEIATARGRERDLSANRAALRRFPFPDRLVRQARVQPQLGQRHQAAHREQLAPPAEVQRAIASRSRHGNRNKSAGNRKNRSRRG